MTNEIQKIAKQLGFRADTGVVLGSGLGGWINNLKNQISVPFSELSGFPNSTVKGHAGKFVFGKLEDKSVIALQGRLHYYEGYGIQKTVLPIRVLKACGIKKLILTNSSGGLAFQKGETMLIIDHLNLTGTNPLIGLEGDDKSCRFTDMTVAYDVELRQKLKEYAKSKNIKLNEGVYAQVSGPNFETPAEVKMLKILGADAVGMSTVCETIQARRDDIRVAGLSFISNNASGLSDGLLTHEDVITISEEEHSDFFSLLTALVRFD